MRQLSPCAFFAALLLGGCLGERRVVETRSATLDVTSLERLRFDVGDGELDIVGDPSVETVDLAVELVTRRLSDDDDGDALFALEVLLEAQDGEARLGVRLQEPPSGYAADVRVTVPARLALLGVDDGGDVRVSDVQSLALRDGSGEIDVRRVAGALTLEDDSGGARIDEVGGEVRVEDTSGDLDLFDLGGDLTVTDESGEIVADGVDGAVSIEDTSGGIELRGVRGDVRIRDASGDITVQTDGRLEVLEDTSGEVEEL